MSTTSITYPVTQKSQRAYNLFDQSQDRLFTVPFPYENRNQIVVRIDSRTTNDYSFHNSNVISIKGEFLKGAQSVTISRDTPIEEPLPPPLEGTQSSVSPGRILGW